MTLETALLTALSAVTGGLCFLFRIIWDKSKSCEEWRAAKEPIITELAERLGLAQGAAKLINSCNIEKCPFAGKLDPTYSVEKDKDKRPKL